MIAIERGRPAMYVASIAAALVLQSGLCAAAPDIALPGAAPYLVRADLLAQAAAAASSLPTLAPVLARVSPGIVNISVEGTVVVQNPLFQDPLFRRFFNIPSAREARRFQAVGSGVIFDADHGYVLTNNHVIEHATRIVVTLSDRRSFRAKLVGTDPQTDVAVLRIDASNLTAVPIGNSSRLRVGDYVAAIGDPFGLGQTATFGIVSALGRSGLGIEGYEDFIQTDASINPGNSGGALVDLNGDLVGINTAILSQSGGNVGIGFAIPIDMVKQVAEQLIAHGKIVRGELGVSIQDLTPPIASAMGIAITRGALVSSVAPGSPAERAGIEAGDVITELNGHGLRDAAELRNEIGLMEPGTTVSLSILRKGKPLSVSATLRPQTEAKTAAAAVSAEGSPLAGVELGAIPSSNPLSGKVTGVYVAGVNPDSAAAQAGLQGGDIIVGVNQKAVATPGEVLAGAARGKGKPLLLDIRRDGRSLFIAIS